MRSRRHAAALATFVALALPGSVARGDVSSTLDQASHAQAEVDALRLTIKRQRVLIHRWHRYARKLEIRLSVARDRLRVRAGYSVTYALRLASAVYGVSYWQMRTVASCESTLNPWATNGIHKGLFQLGWSPFGLSPYDPVANALSAAATVRHDGSWRQWQCKPGGH